MIAQLADRLPPSLVETLTLVVSELVTNALRHAMVADPQPRLTVDITPARVTLAVHDRGSSFDLEALSAEPGMKGWGLRLVDSLVDRWRVERADGTRVVCEIDRQR